MKIPGLDELLHKLDRFDTLGDSLDDINTNIQALILIQAELLRHYVIETGGTVAPQVIRILNILDEVDEGL